jgi:hypothetical protein
VNCPMCQGTGDSPLDPLLPCLRCGGSGWIFYLNGQPVPPREEPLELVETRMRVRIAE